MYVLWAVKATPPPPSRYTVRQMCQTNLRVCVRAATSSRARKALSVEVLLRICRDCYLYVHVQQFSFPGMPINSQSWQFLLARQRNIIV